MQDVQTLVTRYLDAFNESDSARRRAILGGVYAPECSYVDPHVDLRGVEQIDGFIEQTQERFSGVTFRLASVIDSHHNQARFQWHAGPAEAPATFVGFDVIVIENGRIRNVYGFTDAEPAA